MTIHKAAIVLLTTLFVWFVLSVTTSCSDSPSGKIRGAEAQHPIKKVSDSDHFKSIIQNSGDRLLVFDFYADWCKPCKVLTPILEDLAQKFDKTATFFTIDIDHNRELASSVGVRGIPYVLFMKNGSIVHSLMGLHSKDSYARIIQRFSQKTVAEKPMDTPDGEIVNGVRIVRR